MDAFMFQMTVWSQLMQQQGPIVAVGAAIGFCYMA